MHGIGVSFLTLGFTIVIGFMVAALIWALPKIINVVAPDKESK